jgi:hypothetical protein
MGKNGGARPGAGRPTKADEDRVRTIALSAAVKIHGSEEAAFEFLFNHTEPSLIKFAYEHAFGKPRERQDVAMTFPEISIQWPDGD